MYKTEFYESAVKSGFYGIERGGLFGKKDNVRKYRDDISIKLRPVVDFQVCVMGPQVACVLRNCELSQSHGQGCGHGLIFIAEINNQGRNK